MPFLDLGRRCDLVPPPGEMPVRGSDFGSVPWLNLTVDRLMGCASRATASFVQHLQLFVQVNEVRMSKRTAHFGSLAKFE